jgi:hypothetical protein
VTLRNQFAQAPREATEILESVEDELSAITAKATDARGAGRQRDDAQALRDRLQSYRTRLLALSLLGRLLCQIRGRDAFPSDRPAVVARRVG